MEGPASPRKEFARVIVRDAPEGQDGISRAFYATASAQRVVVAPVFVRKTRRTPNRGIEPALKRAKGIAQRMDPAIHAALERLAVAAGTRLKIGFEPVGVR